jgi:hypothetical protein
MLTAIAPDGRVVWRGWEAAYPVVGPDRLYVSSGDGTVFAISLDGARQDTLGTLLTTGARTLAQRAGMTIGRGDVLYVAGPDLLSSLTADGALRFAAPITSVTWMAVSLSTSDPWSGPTGPSISGPQTASWRSATPSVRPRTPRGQRRRGTSSVRGA